MNMTAIDAANNTVEILQGFNDMSGGVLMPFILLILFIVILLTFAHKGFTEVMLLDSFLVTIIGVLLWIGQMVSWHILIIPILLLFSSIFLKIFNG